jgi:hypothetical protein
VAATLATCSRSPAKQVPDRAVRGMSGCVLDNGSLLARVIDSQVHNAQLAAL